MEWSISSVHAAAHRPQLKNNADIIEGNITVVEGAAGGTSLSTTEVFVPPSTPMGDEELSTNTPSMRRILQQKCME